MVQPIDPWRDPTIPPGMFRRVILESPYAGPPLPPGAPFLARAWDALTFGPARRRRANVRYARRALRHSLMLGEAPIASHLLYTQPGVLEDGDADERRNGIEAGLSWGAGAHATVVYLDRGMSSGMVAGIERAKHERRRVFYRYLGPAPTRELDDVPGVALVAGVVAVLVVVLALVHVLGAALAP